MHGKTIHQDFPRKPLTPVVSRGTRFVLRKKPLGTLLSPTAHAVEREYQVLSALHKHNQSPSTKPSLRIPIPRPIALCENVSVIGTPFYIMEFLEGRIFADVKMPQIPPAERREW
jgi:aminoglycoside phosphotransferase (APT) family kinase protein